MPATSIRDLVIKDDDLVVGTHGRGFWILDDITPLRQWPPDADATRGSGAGSGSARTDRAARGAAPSAANNNDGVVLLKPQAATRVEWNRNTDTPLPPDEPAGDNPPDGAIIHYFLRQAATGLVSIEILDSAGTSIRRYSSDDKAVEIRDEGNVPSYWIRPSPIVSTNAGLHRFVWDLHVTPPPGPKAYPIAATPRNTAPEPKGPWVPPGTYTVKLTVGGKAYTQPLVVRIDPRIRVAPIALQQQFTLSKRLYDAMVKIDDLLPKVTEARDRK